MSSFVVEVKKRSRGNVTSPMLVWATAMAVLIFLMEARWGSGHLETLLAVFASALLGVYLGWKRRVAAVFLAPLVSWLFAWPLLWVAALIHNGFISGFFSGLFLVTIGWIGIGLTELVLVGLVAILVRSLRGEKRDPDVVVIDPEGRRG